MYILLYNILLVTGIIKYLECSLHVNYSPIHGHCNGLPLSEIRCLLILFPHWRHLSLAICGQDRFRLSRACALSNRRPIMSADKPMKPYYRLTYNVALRSDFATAQAGLELHCPRYNTSNRVRTVLTLIETPASYCMLLLTSSRRDT